MPEKIIAEMKRSARAAHPGASTEKINHIVYGRLNNQGLMHGSKETAKGAAAESKFRRDHS